MLFVSCTTTSPEAEAQFCQSMGELGESLAEFKSASEQNDMGAFQAAWEDMVEAFGEVQESASQMREVNMNDLALTWRNLETTAKAALGASNPSDSIAGIEQAWSNVEKAYNNLIEVNCK